MFLVIAGFIIMCTASYVVLANRYPKVADNLVLYGIVWYFSKSKSYYLGWLILGGFAELKMSVWLRCLFEASRLYSIFTFAYVVWFLYGKL